jgi:hypothetical protein
MVLHIFPRAVDKSMNKLTVFMLLAGRPILLEENIIKYIASFAD